MNSEPDNNKADQEYIYGEDSAHSIKVFASRIAEKQATFFLPYLQPDMTLIDCGCASGSITVGLAKAVEPGQVTGVDISEAEINRASERVAEKKILNIRFEVGDIYQLDFPANSFDALFSNNVLEHIPDTGRALQEMYRVLKPGGIIGIRNIDADGILLGGDNKLLESILAIYGADYENEDGHFRFGRHTGRHLYEAGFVEVKMSASYDVYSGPERCESFGK